jgi:hypothetical protein
MISPDVFNELTDKLSQAETEEDIRINWLNKILVLEDPNSRMTYRWEKQNQRYRKDLAIINPNWKREVCNVELKKCTNAELFENADRGFFLQAHRYAYSQNFWRNREIFPVLGILTNGYQAIIFDGSRKRQESWNHRDTIDISNLVGINRFSNIFKNLSEGNQGHRLHAGKIENDKNLVVEDLADSLWEFYQKFSEQHLNDAFDYTLQIFLVAVLRDCGFIPTVAMNDACQEGDWERISQLLNSKLSANFRLLNSESHDLIQSIYQETRTLDAAMNRIPPDCLGMVYERFLHKRYANKKSTTYYTPKKLVDVILDELKITPSDKILDPTCGSGSFLTGVIQFVTEQNEDYRQPEQLFRYIKNKIHGVDKDPYACQVAKAMILASAANALDFDPARRDISLPDLNEVITNQDMFQYRPDQKFDVVVGNLPWGSVDGKKKKDIIDDNIITCIENRTLTFKSLTRNTDISAIGIEYTRNHLVKESGKIGLLVKQQSIYGKASKPYLEFCRPNRIKFWDYGPEPFFSNKASLTAIAWYGTDQTNLIEKKYEPNPSLAKDGVLLTDLGVFVAGFQSSADPIYRKSAKNSLNQDLIRSVYPKLTNSRHFILPNNSLEKIVFVPNGIDPPNSFIESLTEDEKKKLKNRAQVAKPYSWRGSEGAEFFKFDGTQMRIVFPRFFTYGSRMLAMVDEKGDGIGITSHTIFVPNNTCNESLVWAIAGWLNSKYLIDELYRIECKFLAGKNGCGFGVYPTELNRLKIPSQLLAPLVGENIKALVKRGENIETIDDFIFNTISILPNVG